MKINSIDLENYKIIRKNVDDFTKSLSLIYDNEKSIVLDIAPEIHEGCVKYFKKSNVKTLDIDKNSKADYILDICTNNSKEMPDETFDIVFCTEVLEHVNNPFLATKELYRIVKKGGIVAASTPFNFRIHNPLPDNWRFTEHGLKVLFSDFESVEISKIEGDRFLMPIHYTVIAKK